jgi:PAS domain S-box-containing protein
MAELGMGSTGDENDGRLSDEVDETLLREIYHATGDGVFVYDPNAREILDANERFCQTLGYDREQARTLSVADLVADADGTSERVLVALDDAAEGEPQRVDCVLQNRAGSTFWAALQMRAVPAADASLVVVSIQDIDERKQRERYLEETNAAHEESLDRMTDGFFTLDNDRRFTYLNETGREIVCEAIGEEMTLEELEGSYIWELIPEVVGTDIQEQYERAFETGETVTFESYYEPLDILFEIRAHPSESGLSVYFRDITEQRRVTEELDATISALHELYTVVSDTSRSFETRRDRIIRMGCSRLDTSYGFLTRITEDTQTIVASEGDHELLQPGEQCRLEESYCKRTISSDGLLAVFDAVEAGWGTDPAYDVFELGSYIGGKVVVDGDLYGTLCFASSEPRERAFTSSEKRFVELASRWVSYELEQRQYRKKINRSRQRYRRLAENFPNGGVYLFDETLTYTLARGEGLQGEGLTPKDVEGHTVQEVFPEDIARLLEEKYRAALEGEEVVFEHQYEGEHFLVRVVPIPTESGENAGMAVTQNITERKEREIELERHKAFLEQSMDVITVLDEDGTVQYQSPAIEQVLGYSQGELIGSSAFELVHPDDQESLFEEFQTMLENSGTTAQSEARFRTANGEWRWLEARGINRLDDPIIEGVVVNSRNVTERKEYEQQLERQNERLEQFASVVSHDLRNPLDVAMTRLELVRADSSSEHLDDIEHAHERMEGLIRDLLTLAREGDIALDRTTVSLEDVATESWQTVETNNGTLVIEDDVELHADTGRLQQLLENLIRNAMEHGSNAGQSAHDDAGEHTDREVRVWVGELEDGFYVEDDGPGIPEAKREQVFDTGYSTTPDGTGFGLDIVSQIVDAHDWTITVTAGREDGARFEITDITSEDQWAP